MEKTKCKKTKTIQITYPAPYSQSFNNDGSPVLMKNHFGRSPKLFNSPKRTVESPRAWSQSYSTVRGPDPTAPHLKYGVFSNRRISSSRALSKNLPLKPFHPHGHATLKREFQEDMSNKNFIFPARKKFIRKAQITESPVFVFRTIDRRVTKQLSLSEIMHVDIKPKKISISPTFCPSPNFKMLQPKLNVSPTARSPR